MTVGIDVRQAVADAHRREWARVLATTVRVAGDLGLAEECVQDAYVAAPEAWLREGVPHNPGAWLTTAARRRALDALRRQQTLRTKLPLLASADVSEFEWESPDEFPEFPDDRLRLVFTCCHPALGAEARVALTLRLVCGLTTAQIGWAFLVSEATMAARVTRAKKKISAAGIPYRVPDPAELPDRLDAVLTVVHLAFTTGHSLPDGDALISGELCERALDLARMLVSLMPDEREARALLGLLVLTHARRGARVGSDGELVLLADQNRALWDRVAIEEGLALVEEAVRGGRPGRFVLQAAIVGVHASAATYVETDWPQIVALYDLLYAAWPSPVVALNRIAAVSMADGPGVALAALEALGADGRLAAYPYFPATRADLLRRLGEFPRAAIAYREALALTTNDVERRFLSRRLAEVTGVPVPR